MKYATIISLLVFTMAITLASCRSNDPTNPPQSSVVQADKSKPPPGPPPSLDEVFGRTTLSGSEREIELLPTRLESGKIEVQSPQPMLQNVLPAEGITLYKWQKPGIEFMVYYDQLDEDEIRKEGLDSADGIFEYGKRTISAVANSRGGQLISAEPDTLAGGYPGIKASSTSVIGGNQYLSRSKLYKIDKRLVAIEVVGYDKDLVKSKPADQFLESLSVHFTD